MLHKLKDVEIYKLSGLAVIGFLFAFMVLLLNPIKANAQDFNNPLPYADQVTLGAVGLCFGPDFASGRMDLFVADADLENPTPLSGSIIQFQGPSGPNPGAFVRNLIPSTFTLPVDCEFDNANRIWVTDISTGITEIFENNGAPTGIQIPIVAPGFMTTNPDKTMMYITDLATDMVVLVDILSLDTDPNFLDVIGSNGGVPTGVFGLVYDTVDDEILVANIGINDVRRFNGLTGQFIGVLASNIPGATDVALGSLVVSSNSANLLSIRNQDTGDAIQTITVNISSPFGLYTGPDGAVYIANNGLGGPGAGGIVRMTRTGVPLQIMISKTAPVNSLNEGESADVTYTINVSNLGEQTATSLTVTDTLPAEATFMSADAACTLNGIVVTCTGGPLEPNGNTSFTIQVSVTAQTANIVNQVLGILEDGGGGMSQGQATHTITVVGVNGGGGGGGCALSSASTGPQKLNSLASMLILLIPVIMFSTFKVVRRISRK